jgi:hypothetical protein
VVVDGTDQSWPLRRAFFDQATACDHGKVADRAVAVRQVSFCHRRRSGYYCIYCHVARLNREPQTVTRFPVAADLSLAAMTRFAGQLRQVTLAQ